ncbi:MAG: hypothetical protein A2W31_15155 [Planctomycetes bacterium RBG_16_64_10]|nr:MAG: hypothetical protein A2W31_15155 [Planctomycetes bacterium RBG_16_64_10]
MNASTAPSVRPSAARFNLPVVGRCAWKEYRQLRAFWLALAGLAVGVQLAPLFLVTPDPEIVASWRFGVAWGAAALYLFGAAATLFATEHEEETYDFLAGLPAGWAPLFWGKVACAAVSAVGLLGALLLTGYLTGGWLTGYVAGGWQWSPTDPRYRVLIVLAPALLEGLAWGTFFSLTTRRPLMAAVLAIATASLCVCWLNAVFGESRALGLVFVESYQASLVPRMMLATAVFLIDVWLARWWLTVDRSPIAALAGRLQRARAAAAPGATALVDEYAKPADKRPGWLAQLRPLIWQTWRESRWTMAVLIALAIPAAVLWAGLFFTDFYAWSRPPGFLGVSVTIPLIIPAALAGACVFQADQRRRRYHFLADRAARPHCVWFARHAVWLGLGSALATVVVAISLVGITMSTWWTVAYSSPERFYYHPGVELHWRDFIPSIVYQVARAYGAFFFALLSGYGAGQLASMLLRSGLLAGFLAVVLSIVMAAWILILTAWDLSYLLFIGPIVLGMLLATSLRAPDWLLDRTTVWSYVKPLAAVVIPTVIVLALVPSERLNQVPALSARSANEPGLQQMLNGSLAEWRAADTPAARETAERYLKLAYQMTSWGSILSEMPADPAHRRDAVVGLSGELLTEFRRRYCEANRDVVRQAIEVSKRRECRFPLFGDDDDSLVRGRMEELIGVVGSSGDWYLEGSDLERALECFLAVLRMKAHISSGQTTSFRVMQWRYGSDCNRWVPLVACPPVRPSELDRFAKWAAHKDQTAARIKGALAQLDEAHAAEPDPRGHVIADYLLLREVVEGKRMPRSIDPRRIRSRPGRDAVLDPREILERSCWQLAYLANRLPWERERSLRALAWMTDVDLISVQIVSSYLSGSLHNQGPEFLRQHLRMIRFAKEQNRSWVHGRLSGSVDWKRTSYLIMREYDLRFRYVFVNEQFVRWVARCRGLKLQLALIAYRLDHADYPPSLEDLVPEYLDQLPDDPYGEGTFQYEAAGLDGGLAVGRIDTRTQQYRSGTIRLYIPAHEPVLWSPGLEGFRIEKVTPFGQGQLGMPVPLQLDPGRGLEGTQGDAVYWLDANEHDSFYGALIFPLPPRN